LKLVHRNPQLLLASAIALRRLDRDVAEQELAGAGATSRLLLLFLPQAVAVALPIAAAIAVFFVCRSWTLPEAVLVLAPLAIAASRIAAPHARR
jgi:hypothetical protein